MEKTALGVKIGESEHSLVTDLKKVVIEKKRLTRPIKGTVQRRAGRRRGEVQGKKNGGGKLTRSKIKP